MTHPTLSKYQPRLKAYRNAHGALEKCTADRVSMEKRLHSLTEERGLLRASVVENPELAVEEKTRVQLATVMGDHQLAEAAMEGLSRREKQAREVAARAAYDATSGLYGDFLQAGKRRVAQRQAALFELIKSWGPGHEGARFTVNPEEIGAWCHRCVEGGLRMTNLQGFGDNNLIPPDRIQEALDFLEEEFTQIPPPADEAAVVDQDEAELKEAA